jgi:hypothetical protein
MELRLWMLAVLVAACGNQDHPAALNTAGTPTAGTTPGVGADTGASGGGAIPATFETFEQVITQAPCFGAGCHNDAQNPLNLRVDDQLYMRLTSRISKNCGNIPIVNPGKPQDSALVKILSGPCGPTPRMPLGCSDDQDGTCIPADYIAAITQWIASGAPQR